MSLASSIPVLGLKRFCPRKGCPYPWPRIFLVSLTLVSNLVSSTPPLLFDYLVRVHNDKGLELCGWEGSGE